MYRIVAQSFPNNEIRVTFSSTPGGRDPFSPAELAKTVELSDLDENDALETVPPLSLVPNSKPERSHAGFGALPVKPTTFGINAKRQLLRHGGALEHHAPPEECLFLTGTLPGSTEDSFRAIAEWSGYIVHRLKAWVAKHEKSKMDFYCWEYQKRGALHLHYCVRVRDDEHRRHILDGFRDWWIQILHRVGEFARTDMFRKNSGKTWLDDLSKVRAIAEVCRKSPARYLAKYLSKSASPQKGNARFFAPSRWWGTSRALSAAAALLSTCQTLIESGVQAVRRAWENVSHFCDTSESVTYSYRHRVGIGETYVCYPTSPEEHKCLMSQLASISMMSGIVSESISLPPSQELKELRNIQSQFFSQSLKTSLPISTGLRCALEAHLNWTLTLTPTTSPEPLSVLLSWAANVSAIVSMCQFTPLWTTQNKKQFNAWASCLERNIERVAEEGWS
jgi:hypothetical protein